MLSPFKTRCSSRIVEVLSAPTSAPDRLRSGGPVSRRLGLALLGLWATTTFLLVGSLAIAHWAPLPRPELNDIALRRALATHRLSHEKGFLALHVLYTACRCSRGILSHLAARGAGAGVYESVVLVGAEAAYRAPLERRGFRVSSFDERAFGQHFPIATAPLLVVAAPDDSLRYVGGYTARKQGLDVRDEALIAEAVRGAEGAALPVFGCAVSRSLQRLLDPFGLKYSTR